MTVFMGITKDFTEEVAERLVGFVQDPKVPDLSRILLVLPGKETIRNLSELLTERHGSLFPPVMITGNAFALYGKDLSRTAGRAEEYCAWMKAVSTAPPEEYPGLLPGGQEDPDRKLAARTALAFGDLRRELEEGGKSLDDLARITGEERFGKLAQLEKQVTGLLHEQGKETLLESEKPGGTECGAFDSFGQVIFAGVIDLSPAGTRRAEALLKNGRAEVWIYAPEAWKEFFDGTGHPLPPASEWVRQIIRIRDFGKRVLKAENPAEGAGIASALVTEDGTLSPDASRIIVTDPSFFPFVRDELEKTGPGETPPDIYDPAGERLSGLRIAAFLRTLEDFLNSGSCDSAENLLRNPDLLRSLIREENAFLTALDSFRENCLPDRPENALEFLKSLPDRPENALEKKRLLPALEQLEKIRSSFSGEGAGFVPALRALLNRVFPDDRLSPVKGIPFEAEAAAVSGILDEMEPGDIPSPGIGFALLRKLMENVRVYGDHTGFAYPVHGFYESPFFSAADTVLLGVNGGFLPEQKQNTPFLTESLREKLGLDGNTAQETRDAFRLAVLTEHCAAAKKKIGFITLRFDASRSPCRFSPFLFGRETEFLKRTQQLYAELPPIQARTGKEGGSTAFALRLPFISRGAEEKGLTLSVTDFKCFISSPLLFFLQRRLHWEDRDYHCRELDQAEIGTLCHAAVQTALHLPASGKSNVLSDRLKDRLSELMKEQYGDPLPRLLFFQRKMMEQRLDFAAPHLMESLRDYRVLETEYRLGGEKERSILFRAEKNWRIAGRIDRIEYSETRKELRLIDFKTSEKTPDEAHVKRKKEQFDRFLDLQLPLYAILIRRDPAFRERHPELDWENLTVRCGYFLLPQTEEKSGISMWDRMDDPLLEKAEVCAAEIFAEAEAMQRGNFPEKWDKSPSGWKDPLLEKLMLPDPKTVFPGIGRKEKNHD